MGKGWMLGGLFVILVAQPVLAAQTNSAPASDHGAAGKLIDVGNKICPVSGNPIGSMGPGIQHAYHGKVYHLCCGGCIRLFDGDPEKYSKIAENQSKSR
jgi:YHS domain-containing protein